MSADYTGDDEGKCINFLLRCMHLSRTGLTEEHAVSYSIITCILTTLINCTISCTYGDGTGKEMSVAALCCFLKAEDLFVQSLAGADIETPPAEKNLKKSQCTPLFMNAFTLRSTL